MTIQTCLNNTGYKITKEISKAVLKLGGNQEILSLIGSWGDTMDDEEILICLKGYNETGSKFKEIYAQVKEE